MLACVWMKEEGLPYRAGRETILDPIDRSGSISKEFLGIWSDGPQSIPEYNGESQAIATEDAENNENYNENYNENNKNYSKSRISPAGGRRTHLSPPPLGHL